MTRLELSIAGALLLLVCLGSRAQRADEPVGAREPRLMSETAEITTRRRRVRRGRPVRSEPRRRLHAVVEAREDPARDELAQPGSRRAASSRRPRTSRRTTRQRVDAARRAQTSGIYKDLALIFRVPLILSWSQSSATSTARAPSTRSSSPTRSAGSSSPCRSTSPTRSGIDYISGGLDWAIFNQQRDSTKPTWVVGDRGAPRRSARRSTPATRTRPSQCPDPTNPRTTRRRTATRASAAGCDAHHRADRSGRAASGTSSRTRASGCRREFAQARSDFGAYNPTNDPRPDTRRSSGRSRSGSRSSPASTREQFQRLERRLPLQGHVPVAGARLLGALRRARLVELRRRCASRTRRRTCTAAGGERAASRTRRGAGVLHRHHRGAGVRELHARRRRPRGRRASTSSSPRRARSRTRSRTS